MAAATLIHLFGKCIIAVWCFNFFVCHYNSSSLIISTTDFAQFFFIVSYAFSAIFLSVKLSIKIPSKHGGKTLTGGANREKDGTTKKSQKFEINLLKCPGTILDYSNGGDKNKVKRQHPATFPDKIPYDMIQVFTKEGDLILDPMCGSGSTCVAAKVLGRNFIGIDISEEYCEISKVRLKNMETSLKK
jgi:site-specific DNA-methyltransferase (adenine-specific)